MIEWFKNNKKGIIRGMFLVPIVLVMIISISHVVSWYSLSNPISWAIYLSVAIEIAAMSSIAAASVKVKGGVWLVFIIVTLIQFIGNIFFCFNEIDTLSKEFKSWVELTGPIFEGLGSDLTDMVAQKRWLALLEGGLLPIISLASLHFFIKYDGDGDGTIKKIEEPKWKGRITRTSPMEVKEELVEEVITPAEEVTEEVVLPLVEEVNTPTTQETTVLNKDKKNVISLNNIRRVQGLDKWQ